MISNSLDSDCVAPISAVTENDGETAFVGQEPNVTAALSVEAERESEISRLTWAVLDGVATRSERERLAELVNAQHVGRKS